MPLPKIDLHLHLDGSVLPETMWQLGTERHLSMPASDLASFRRFLAESADCRDVNTYLGRFELPLRLMQDRDTLVRVTRELIGLLASQGLVYAEIRFAPQLHTRCGLSQRDAVEAVLEGRRQGLAENPGIGIGILLCAMSVGPAAVNMAENLATVRLGAEYLGAGVAGIDLAGAEGLVPLRSFHPVFDLARERNVPFTCHAGDSQGPDTVRDALAFGARRIGHGHRIFDDPSLWPEAIRRGVTLEICPTSNIQCKTQPSYREHPAKKLLDAGLRVTINTDNMTLAATDLDAEYRFCTGEMGFTAADLRTMLRYSAEAAFLPEAEKSALLARLA